MKDKIDYISINKKSWNQRTDCHIDSEFYDNKAFLAGKSSLNTFELDMLGDVKRKKILHLQCHFGQDSISLTRMGAKVTGVDLSDVAIERASEFAKSTGADAKFVCCNVYDLDQHLDEKFDIVFTSYGTISWLPDLDRWAQIISHFLKPEGKFVFVEFHPVIWMFDDQFNRIAYNYNNNGPIIETEQNTYADKEANINLECVAWNHGIGEVLNSLIKNDIQIESLKEYDYSPYKCFNKLNEFEKGKYRVEHLGDKIPMVYSILGKKIK